MRRALAEDLGPLGDLTAALVPADASARADVVARVDGVLAGTACATEVFAQLDTAVAVEWLARDGAARRARRDRRPRARAAPLGAHRRAHRAQLPLPPVGRRDAITRRFVDAAGDRLQVWDTRKTLPGLRALEKAAVRAGGGVNHRGSLSDMVLLKDNHLAGVSIGDAVRDARARWPGRAVEVECDRIDQVDEALAAGATMVLLDNMTPERGAGLRRRWSEERVLVEVSGGVTLENVGAYAGTGADLVSTSVITQSAPALDLAFDIARIADLDGGRDAADHRLRQHPDRHRALLGSGARRPLAHRHRRRAHVRRARARCSSSSSASTGSRSTPRSPACRSRPACHACTAALREMSERYFGFPALVLESGVRTGMPILYDEPKNVGADRIANAIGAYDLYGGPTIVVDFGTANTVDAVSVKGEYLGGAIFPGIEISLDALFARAAALRRVELRRAEERDRQVDDRSDPVGRGVRLQRPDRRAGRPLRGRARHVDRGRDRRPGRS